MVSDPESHRSDVAAIFEGRYLRSPAHDWLDENYLEIARLNVGRRIAWKPVAEHLATIKIYDGSGKPPTPRRLANLWVIVKAGRTGNLVGSEAKPMARSSIEREGSPGTSPVPLPAAESEPSGGRPPALRRRRQFEEEPPAVLSDEEALEQMADFVDSLETAGGSGWKKPRNVHREKLEELRAAKAAALAAENNEPT